MKKIFLFFLIWCPHILAADTPLIGDFFSRFLSYTPLLISTAVASRLETPHYQVGAVAFGFFVSQMTNKSIADHDMELLKRNMFMNIRTVKDNPYQLALVLSQQDKLQRIELNRNFDAAIMSIGASAAGIAIYKTALKKMKLRTSAAARQE